MTTQEEIAKITQLIDTLQESLDNEVSTHVRKDESLIKLLEMFLKNMNRNDK